MCHRLLLQSSQEFGRASSVLRHSIHSVYLTNTARFHTNLPLCLASFHPLSVCILQTLPVFTPTLPHCLASFHPLSVCILQTLHIFTPTLPLFLASFHPLSVCILQTLLVFTPNLPLCLCVIPSTQCVYFVKPAQFTPTPLLVQIEGDENETTVTVTKCQYHEVMTQVIIASLRYCCR